MKIEDFTHDFIRDNFKTGRTEVVARMLVPGMSRQEIARALLARHKIVMREDI